MPPGRRARLALLLRADVSGRPPRRPELRHDRFEVGGASDGRATGSPPDRRYFQRLLRPSWGRRPPTCSGSGGFASYRLRCLIQRKADRGPDRLLGDFIRHNFFGRLGPRWRRRAGPDRPYEDASGTRPGSSPGPLYSIS